MAPSLDRNAARGRGGHPLGIGPRVLEMYGCTLHPAVGARAPHVELTDASGRPWSSADHAGRVVVLIFHRHIH